MGGPGVTRLCKVRYFSYFWMVRSRTKQSTTESGPKAQRGTLAAQQHVCFAGGASLLPEPEVELFDLARLEGHVVRGRVLHRLAFDHHRRRDHRRDLGAVLVSRVQKREHLRDTVETHMRAAGIRWQVCALKKKGGLVFPRTRGKRLQGALYLEHGRVFDHQHVLRHVLRHGQKTPLRVVP